MNRDDRATLLALIAHKQPALLADVHPEEITDEQIMTLVEQAMTPPPVPAEAAASGVLWGTLARVIAANNLRYQDHAQVQVEEGGVTRTRWQTVYREIRPEDVLASRDLGGGLVRFTVGDGKRYELLAAS